MIIDCVLSASNLNPLYLEFIPMYIKCWSKLLPLVDIKIILIAKEIPESLLEFSNNLILFDSPENISSVFVSQIIRLFYPCLLNYKNGVIITDIDIMPMNSKYYTDNIKNIENDKFIYYRNVCMDDFKEIAMCYNVAIPDIWSEIFNIKTIEDIKNKIIDFNKVSTYKDNNNNLKWTTDQLFLYDTIMEWNKKTNRFIFLNDNNTGFSRLDRNTFMLNADIEKNIKNGYYSDYHAYRPYSTYKHINDKIYDLLPDNKEN